MKKGQLAEAERFSAEVVALDTNAPADALIESIHRLGALQELRGAFAEAEASRRHDLAVAIARYGEEHRASSGSTKLGNLLERLKAH